ncbi:lipoprotein [Colwellia asteriadis]
MQNKSLNFVLLVTFLMLTLLSGCGAKGDLYQTPAPEAVENNEDVDESTTKNKQPVETPVKKSP